MKGNGNLNNIWASTVDALDAVLHYHIIFHGMILCSVQAMISDLRDESLHTQQILVYIDRIEVSHYSHSFVCHHLITFV